MKRWQELEKAVEDLLNLKKIKYLKISSYRCFSCGQVQNAKAKGFPDFFCYHPALAIEAKSGKTARLTKEQKEVMILLKKSGIQYIVVRDTIEELIELIDILLGKEKNIIIDKTFLQPKKKRKLNRTRC